MNEELISLIIGWVLVAVLLVLLEFLDKKRKLINENYKNKIIKNKKI
jgi:hypothetical protein